MEYVILGLLILSPSSIYQLKKSFEQGISLFYGVSLGNIQVTLKKLEHKAWIRLVSVEESGRKRKIYGITDQGYQVFLKWMFEPPDIANLETQALAKLYFLGILTSSKEKTKVLEGILSQITRMTTQLEQLSGHLNSLELPKSSQEIFTYQVKTLEYGIMAHRAADAWFRSVLDEVKGGE